tara:strand:- start:62554 stop:63630 length:1077 start_codon:yes stop_codon:yes gene_type:complete
MIPVTKTFIPPLNEYSKILERAFDNNWLTNRGELVCELESELAKFLALDEARILCTNNGTTPIQIALKLLGQNGEVITTPFSYVATTSSIVWENCKPVFVDIHPDYLTIDESKIEEAITEKTTCILATHVFGNPCNISEIERIAKKHDLKVIFDAAHCFGVEYKGKSIFEYGDLSTCSFHATKLFHTGEGGAIFCKDKELFNRVYYSHNFGHDGPLKFHGLGINGKMSELSAAMGLCVLPYIKEILSNRERIVGYYQKHLSKKVLDLLAIRKETKWNFSYFPVVFKSEDQLIKTETLLNELDIYPRRYFYPSLTELPYVNQGICDISTSISHRVMCLPLYSGLLNEDLVQIVKILNEI